jgi:hypothetical protein
MDVEASLAIRQAEVGASQTMIERTEACSASNRTGSRPTPPSGRVRRRGEQFAHASQITGAGGAGEKAVMADTMQPLAGRG